MRTLAANNVDELKQHIAGFNDAYLFRGQVKHYPDDKGLPVLNSSFVRQGCVPPLMLKWIFYVEELLRRGGFEVERPDTGDITQGLLQHYGWRSFFVDLSSSPSVAAWFASHSFEAKPGFNFCENSFEEPVMLRVQRAHYSKIEGAGNLYVLSKTALTEGGHKLVSLFDDLPTDCPTRFIAQKAWLASIYRNQRRLEPSAIIAHVTAPAEALSALAAEAGFKETDDLFPAPEQDAILKNFLSLPRLKIPVPNPPFPFFMRSLDIPEYQDSFVKHLPTTTVLADLFWPSERVEGLKDGLCIRAPEEIFYGEVPVGEMPRLLPLLEANPVTHIETENLICFPVIENSITYEKGMAIRRTDNGLYEIGGLGVDYQSDRMTGVGVARGYSYKIEANRLVRVAAENDCPCGDTRKHFYHLRACAVLDDLMGAGKATRNGNILTVSF